MRRRTQRGATFIVTLAVLAGLVAIVAGAAFTQHAAAKAAMNRMEGRRAHLAAEAGLQRAIQVFETATPGVSTQQDDWYTLGTTGSDEFLLGNGSFRMQIVDASSRININTANATLLGKLPLTQEQVDCLLDWRTAGQTAMPDGAKDDYYHALTNPYNTKLRRIDTLDELLQVKNFTADTLYDPQNLSGPGIIQNNPSNPQNTTNSNNANTQATLYDLVSVDSLARAVSPAGRPLTNINTATNVVMVRAGIPNNVANAIIQRRNQQGTFQTMEQVMRVPQVTTQVIRTLIDNFAVDSQTTHAGRYNVNTCSIDILEALPGVTPDIAQQIVTMQTQGIQSMGQLLSIPGMNNKSVIGPLSDLLAVNSCEYLVRVVGKAGDTTCTLEALLRTDGTTPQIVWINYPPFSDMTTRWNWSDTSNQITLGDTK